MIIGKTIETLLGNLRDSFNRFVNGKQVVGYQVIDLVTALGPQALTVPAGATEALLIVEKTTPAGSGDLAAVAIRWSVTSTAPEAGGYTWSAGPPVNPIDGMPWPYMTPLILKGTETLTSFRCITGGTGITAGSVGLKVTYFK